MNKRSYKLWLDYHKNRYNKKYTNKNNILLYYGLMCFIIALPIIDYYHVSLFLIIPTNLTSLYSSFIE